MSYRNSQYLTIKCNTQVKDTFYGENAKAVGIHGYRCAVKVYGHITLRRVFIPAWEVTLGDKIKLHNEKIYNLYIIYKLHQIPLC